jgi:actin related protein 2/3 complex subunit 1A/1B
LHYDDQLFCFLPWIEWTFFSVLDKSVEASAPVASSGEGGVKAARELFRNKTVRGQDLKLDTDTLKTTHDRPITGIRNALAGNKKATKISTSGLDGKLIVWDLQALEFNLATLGI